MKPPSAWGPQASPGVTGSVPPPPAPTHKVETSALAPPTYGGSAGIGGIGTPARQEVTGSVSTHQKQPAPAWSWDGGTAVIVAQGETIDTISRRHGVPAPAIMQANNMTHAAQLQPGQRPVIPRAQPPIAQAPQGPPADELAGP